MAKDTDLVLNSYRILQNCAKLPKGRSWGAVVRVQIDPDGKNVWTLDRCRPNGCMGPRLDPIQNFDQFGTMVASFGGGMFNWPHGFFVERNENVWVTEGIAVNGKGGNSR